MHDKKRNNPYAPPDADLTGATPSEALVVRKLLSEERLLGALFGGFIGAFIGVALWIALVIITHQNSGILAAVVGPIVGLFVRFNGRGVRDRFAVIAAIYSFLASVAGAAVTGLPPFQFLWMFLGMGFAGVLAKRRLEGDEERAVWYWKNVSQGQADRFSKNR